MKNALFILLATTLLSACNGAANDENPETDTSSFPRDTALANPADTSSHVNIAGGQHNADSLTLDTSRRGSAMQDSTN